jgi:hypothetical protein
MTARRRRRRRHHLRLIVTSTGVVVVTSAGLVLGASTTFGSVSGAAGSTLPTVSSAPVVGAEVWTLDVPADLDMPGLTRPAELAMVDPQPSPIQSGDPGIERPIPLKYDYLEAHLRAREERANLEALRASAGERDADWQARRGLLPADLDDRETRS